MRSKQAETAKCCLQLHNHTYSFTHTYTYTLIVCLSLSFSSSLSSSSPFSLSFSSLSSSLLPFPCISFSVPLPFSQLCLHILYSSCLSVSQKISYSLPSLFLSQLLSLPLSLSTIDPPLLSFKFFKAMANVVKLNSVLFLQSPLYFPKVSRFLYFTNGRKNSENSQVLPADAQSSIKFFSSLYISPYLISFLTPPPYLSLVLSIPISISLELKFAFAALLDLIASNQALPLRVQ